MAVMLLFYMNEWFRASIRKFLDDIERKKMLQKLKKIELEGLEEKDIEEIVNRWRSEKNVMWQIKFIFRKIWRDKYTSYRSCRSRFITAKSITRYSFNIVIIKGYVSVIWYG